MGDDTALTEMWQGFSSAIVRLWLPTGEHILAPEIDGSCGLFPELAGQNLHIITAYNPGGLVSELSNTRADQRLAQTLKKYVTYRSMGSARDGSYAEPGFAVAQISEDEALAIGRAFSQVAIYSWGPTALEIIACNGTHRVTSGWSLEPA